MKATEAKLLDFLKKSPQFVIPIYQRTYSWTAKECLQLWDDIIRTGKDNSVLAHFVGSIVYIEKGLYQISSQSPLLVIDGQQRLTTVTLLLSALVKFLENAPSDAQEPVDGFTPRKLKNYYLLNPLEEGERYFKLILSQTDKTSLMAIVDGRDRPKEPSHRVIENYNFFESLIEKSDLQALCKGLAKLIVVDIALSRDQDNPQLIFESMNSTGRELTQADLIRNFILMSLEPTRQTQLYEEYWRPMEKDFGQEAYGSYFDRFMRHYLTVKTGEIPNVREVYEAFKSHVGTKDVKEKGVEYLLREIKKFSQYFCSMVLGAETDEGLKKAFHDLRELKVDVAYPFLLELYEDYKKEVLSRNDFLQIVRLIEAYVFRRAVCNIPTNSMNKTFGTFTKTVNKNCYLESVKAHFQFLPSYRRFPNDDEFKRDLQTRDLYKFRSRSYWLRRLENHGRKERVTVDEYTIEHILPQNENLPVAWKNALGPNWDVIQQTYLHTLGNLTLTGYNSEYSDKPFSEKRDMKGGFKESPLKLNIGLGNLKQWNEATIKDRALNLAQEAVLVWSAPNLNLEILENHKTKSIPKNTYTIKDHAHLGSRHIRELFEVFRTEVMRLDPCISEEFLKHYVAYKAETNFVDVIPQAKRLRLLLNIPFNEISDPKKMCRDVSALGRWGNGEVEIALANLKELPYVMGLVRQSLEQQMGEKMTNN